MLRMTFKIHIEIKRKVLFYARTPNAIASRREKKRTKYQIKEVQCKL